MILVILSGAWVAGIIAGSLFHVPFYLIFSGLVPLTLLGFLRKRVKLLVLVSLSITAFVGGSIRYTSGINPNDNTRLQFYNGSAVDITGMVSRDPDIRDNGIQMELTASSIRTNNVSTNIIGKVLLFIPAESDYRYGDILHLHGKLETPPAIDDFDYKGYLANQGIDSVMRLPGIQLVDRGQGNGFIGWIYSLRHNMARSLSRILPEPQASLAKGILLGMRGNIPQDLKDDFSRSGTTHILAISGQNLSIVAGILISIGLWCFGRRHYIYIWLAMLVIVIYTLMTGISLPVVRSAIMTLLFLFAELAGRQRSAPTALAFAAAVMVGITPRVFWDASFQLSFLSMAGLVVIAPGLQDFSRNTVTALFGEKGFYVSFTNLVLDSFCVTLAALLAVWPVIAYYFGIISLVAPVSSLLAVPAMTAIIVTSALAGLLGIIFVPIGQVMGCAAWIFLSYLLLVVKSFAALPAASVPANFITSAFIFIYYACLLVIIWTAAHRKKVWYILKASLVIIKRGLPYLYKKQVTVPLLISALLVTVAVITLPDGKFHIEFLDVGQGDAILITRGDQQVLVDGGPSPQAINMELGSHMPFWDRKIELVVMTHPDSDHLSGLVEVLQRYQVEHIICPDFSSDSSLYQRWQSLLSDRCSNVTIAAAGQRIDLGNGATIDILNPHVPPEFSEGSDDNGIVLRLAVGKTSFLLTADITAQGEFALISGRAHMESTVFKAAHHGSANSNTAEFLHVIRPLAAVISVGKDNRYGHPSPDVLSRLTAAVNDNNVYRTDEDGTVEFITDGERLWVTTEN